MDKSDHIQSEPPSRPETGIQAHAPPRSADNPLPLPNPTFKKRRTGLWWLIAGVVGIVVWYLTLAPYTQSGIRSRLAYELPNGTSEAEVEEWLKKHHCRFGWASEGANMIRIRSTSPFSNRTSVFLVTEFYLTFHFSTGKLHRVDIEEIGLAM